ELPGACGNFPRLACASPPRHDRRLPCRPLQGQDGALAEQAKRGLARMFAEHGPVLRGFFARRGANDDAEDLVQETYLRLLRARQGQAAIANPEAYLFTVALNLAREQAARRRRTPVPL